MNPVLVEPTAPGDERAHFVSLEQHVRNLESSLESCQAENKRLSAQNEEWRVEVYELRKQVGFFCRDKYINRMRRERVHAVTREIKALRCENADLIEQLDEQRETHLQKAQEMLHFFSASRGLPPDEMEAAYKDSKTDSKRKSPD